MFEVSNKDTRMAPMAIEISSFKGSDDVYKKARREEFLLSDSVRCRRPCIL